MRRKRSLFAYISYSIIGILLVISLAAFINGITGDEDVSPDAGLGAVEGDIPVAGDSEYSSQNENDDVSVGKENTDSGEKPDDDGSVRNDDATDGDNSVSSDDVTTDDAVTTDSVTDGDDATDVDDAVSDNAADSGDNTEETLSEKEVSPNEIEIPFDVFE